MGWWTTRRTKVAAAGLAAVVVGGTVAAVVLAASASAGTTATETGTITVSASGQAAGTPDTMTVQMGVSTTAASASAALDADDAETGRLATTFTGAGVPSSGLQTSGLDLSPSYDNSGNVDGYQADDELTVTMHQLSRAGAIIDAAAHAVGNDVRIEGISFSLSDTSSLLRAARAAAMRNARLQAGELAAAAGASVGAVLKVTDDEQPAPPPPLPYAFRAAASAANGPPVPVQAGTTPISVQVRVVYSLRG